MDLYKNELDPRLRMHRTARRYRVAREARFLEGFFTHSTRVRIPSWSLSKTAQIKLARRSHQETLLNRPALLEC